MIHRLFCRRRPSVWPGFCLALILALTAGCQGINHLRAAQDAFNQAATTDMTAVLGSDVPVDESIGADAVSKWVSGRNYYGSALTSLKKIDAKDERVLRDEQLWGAKLTLEALCYWKLGNYEKALEVAREAQQTGQLYPRDRAVMQALPGLVMIDYAFDLRSQAAIAKRESDSTNGAVRLERRTELTNLVSRIEELTVGEEGAIVGIEAARSPHLVEPGHPVHVYLIQCQLAAYRNYRKGCELLDQTGVPNTDPAHVAAQSHLDDLARRVSGSDGQRLVNRWVELNKLTARTVSP